MLGENLAWRLLRVHFPAVASVSLSSPFPSVPLGRPCQPRGSPPEACLTFSAAINSSAVSTARCCPRNSTATLKFQESSAWLPQNSFSLSSFPSLGTLRPPHHSQENLMNTGAELSKGAEATGLVLQVSLLDGWVRL